MQTKLGEFQFLSQGLIQIEMLKTIEQLTGKPILELFDWIVGTSIGGVLALGTMYGEACHLSSCNIESFTFKLLAALLRL